METATGSLNRGDTLSYERIVERVFVATGKLLVSAGGKEKTVKEGAEFKPGTSVSLYALEPTNYAITFTESAVVVNG